MIESIHKKQAQKLPSKPVTVWISAERRFLDDHDRSDVPGFSQKFYQNCHNASSSILILGNFAPYQRSLVQVQGAKRSPQATALPPEFP
jgi:hypothetical protein